MNITPDVIVTRGVELSPKDVEKWVGEAIRSLEKSWQGVLLTMGEDAKLGSDFAGLRLEMMNAVLPLLRGKDSQKVREALARAQQIMSAFLQTKDVVSHVDRRGLVDMLKLSVESALEPESLKDIEIRIGFGAGPTTLPNARVPSYLLPAKKTLTDLRGALPDAPPEALPRVVPYSAANFVAAVNTDDGEVRQKAAEENFAFLKAYMLRFAPELAAQFHFDEDRPVKPGERIDVLLDIYADALRKANSLGAEQAVEKVKGMGQRNGSTEENALRYAASHALYSADDVAGPSEAILQSSEARPRAVVMMGGKAEKDFWRVRETLRQNVSIPQGIAYLRDRIQSQTGELTSEGHTELLQRFEECQQQDSSPVQRVQLITRAGEKVPVYNSTQGDWSIEDVTTRSFDELEKSMDGRLKPDLLAVLCDIAGIPLSEAYAGSSKKSFAPDVRAKLMAAYEQYASFCREFLEKRNS